MKRRNFLKITGLGTALAAVPGISFVSNSFKESAVGLIMHDLDYLKLDRTGVEDFTNDYFKETDTKYRLKVRIFYLLRISAKDSYTVEQIVRNYLLASNFFYNGSDENKQVNYLGLYDPYKRPCANPFSSLYYPAQNV